MTSFEVARSSEIHENAPFATKANGVQLVLTRVDGKVYAIENKCSHLGLSMARGSVNGSVIQCPWHGSKFDMCTGENLDWVNSIVGMPIPQWSRSLVAFGKSPAPVRRFDAHEEDGRVFVDI